jgi:hypothetical protein
MKSFTALPNRGMVGRTAAATASWSGGKLVPITISKDLDVEHEEIVDLTTIIVNPGSRHFLANSRRFYQDERRLEEVALTNGPDRMVRVFLRATDLSARVMAALPEARKRKGEPGETLHAPSVEEQAL